jgi:HopA1 effector protein family
MADYSRFEPSLSSWLQKVWASRAEIKQDVMLYADEPELARFARKSGANAVYDLYNTSAKVNVDDDDWKRFQARLKVLEDHYHIPYRTSHGFVKDSWFSFAVDPSEQGSWRIYLRFKDPISKWVRVALYCLNNVCAHRIKGIVEFKVAGPGLSKERGDHMVIYLKDRKSVDSTLEFLKTDPEMSGLFSGNVPAGVKQVAPGLGFSAEIVPRLDDSPAINEVWNNEPLSFGSYLAGVIYMALEQSWDKTEDHYVDELLKYFLQLRIDPRHPHLLRSIPEEEFQMMVQNTQGKIVREKLSPQPRSGVMIDQTRPFPTTGTHV